MRSSTEDPDGSDAAADAGTGVEGTTGAPASPAADRPADSSGRVPLDSLAPSTAVVGYGVLGLGGLLGYEDKPVIVGGRRRDRALSTHPPAVVEFEVGGRYASFHCHVALNDDAPAGAAHADFLVVADDRRVAIEARVMAGESPRPLTADISGARTLRLVARTSRWDSAHAVWLDPVLSEAAVAAIPTRDCLDRCEFEVTGTIAAGERCLATVASPGFEAWLDDLLGSVLANAGRHEFRLVVFVLDGGARCEAIAAKYGATLVRCRSRARLNPMSKAVLYSVARVVEARQYLCLDADMLVLGDLRPVFEALDALPPGTVLACREGNTAQHDHLGRALRNMYGGTDAEARQLRMTPAEEAFRLVVNDGLFAGDQSALLALDAAIRAMPEATRWADGNPRVSWRNQFVFNLALARLGCGVELDATYNLQLHAQEVRLGTRGARLEAWWRDRPVRVLHFSGAAKRQHTDRRGQFARVTEPLPVGVATSAYDRFLDSLRAWIGRYGLEALAWSMYGLASADGARVADPGALPLLAALHYLVRANGCVRVLETGTARGISAACLASAVAHREGGRVVTLDPYRHEGREELWETLPESFRACIEARQTDSITGLRAARDAGEPYEVVLLDSIHTEDHVWAEFQLAAEITCPGGLILVHDAVYRGGTVGAALDRIRAAGYGVVRLWTAEGGVREDDGLGLAVIENRRTCGA